MAEINTEIAELLRQQNVLFKELKDGMQTKAPAAFGTAVELHGNGSLFGSYPIERDVITAHMRPMGGLHEILPRYPSVTENPIFATLTGFTATNGARPTNPCDPAPKGFMKGCDLSAQFGRLSMNTNTIEIDKVMLKLNRGDFTDLRLLGSVLGGTSFTPANLNQENLLNVVTKAEMVIAGVNIERDLSKQTWQGNPANNTAGGGYKEFPGLDRQIATGQVDWHNNTACPALDSDVKNFAYSMIDSTTRDIVEYLSMLAYYLENNAEGMGLNPVQWVIVMRPQLWFELSAVWPCRYMTNKCTSINSGGSPIAIINDNVNVSMRDAMRNGKYIDINGKKYPVVTDPGIYEHTNITNANLLPGQYSSSIYMVPLSIVGGFPVTYFEYVDYKKAAPDIALLNGKEIFWTDDGIFMWAMGDNYFCYDLMVKTEQRIILRTPQLAGRIDAIRYSPLQHVREPFPESNYWKDGGVSIRPDVSGFHVW